MLSALPSRANGRYDLLIQHQSFRISARCSVAEQIPFGGESEFAINTEPRCPCVLLVDVSKSMAGARIAALNEGLKAYRDDLISDSLARQRVEVAVVTFGGRVETVSPFAVAEQFTPPTLTVSGDTPLGAALLRAIELVAERKRAYGANGVQSFRPWIFLITDGGPTDEWQSAAELVRKGEAAKKFTLFTIGVQGAKMDILRQIGAEKPPLSLDGLKFRELFLWLSATQKIVSSSRPGEEEGMSVSDPNALLKWAKL
jgi:uncharacterized protein YegL